MCTLVVNNMKTKTYHTVETVSKSNRKPVKTEAKSIPRTQM